METKYLVYFTLILAFSICGCRKEEPARNIKCDIVHAPLKSLPKDVLCIDPNSTGNFDIHNGKDIDVMCAASEVKDRLDKLDDAMLAPGILYSAYPKMENGYELEGMLKELCIKRKINFYEFVNYNSVINTYVDVLVWSGEGSSKKKSDIANLKTFVMPGTNATIDAFCITRVNDDCYKISGKTYSKKEFDQFIQESGDDAFADGIYFETNLPFNSEKDFKPFEKSILDSYGDRNINVFAGFATEEMKKKSQRFVFWIIHRK